MRIVRILPTSEIRIALEWARWGANNLISRIWHIEARADILWHRDTETLSSWHWLWHRIMVKRRGGGNGYFLLDSLCCCEWEQALRIFLWAAQSYLLRTKHAVDRDKPMNILTINSGTGMTRLWRNTAIIWAFNTISPKWSTVITCSITNKVSSAFWI